MSTWSDNHNPISVKFIPTEETKVSSDNHNPISVKFIPTDESKGRRPKTEPLAVASSDDDFATAALMASDASRFSSSPPNRGAPKLLSRSPPSLEVSDGGHSDHSDHHSDHHSKLKELTSTVARKLSASKKEGRAVSPSPAMSDRPRALQTVTPEGLPSLHEDGVVSYEALLRLFECPKCAALMMPPLIQCRRGHLICDRCRSAFKMTCPICQQRITDSSNIMMDQVCYMVRFPCKFAVDGCPEFLPIKQKSDHEQFCFFRPVSCHFATLGCDFVVPLKDMKEHVLSCSFRQKEQGKKK